MAWKPIDTAPADRQVRLGKWLRVDASWRWLESSGIVFRTRKGLFRTFVDPGYNSEEYQYWDEIPPPPDSPPQPSPTPNT